MARQKVRKVEKRVPKNGSGAVYDENAHGLLWKLSVFIIAVTIGVIHRNHCAGMFERDRHFSHLSDMEREMTFRTEMGLYYSYFKTIVKAPSVWDGFERITKDNVSEYGHTINTLKRFNLYPEMVMGVLFRGFKSVTEGMKIKTTECWHTNRGEGLEPIVSCEGMGNQFYFYINLTFALAGTVASSLFLYGVLLSDSIVGGLLVIGGFAFNHGEATRVQWTPPLRESFGYPIFLAQMLCVSYVIKFHKWGLRWAALIGLLTASFMLPWQFASFALSTQVAAAFFAYTLEYIPIKTMKTIGWGHLIGFLLGFVFLFGNEMLLSSLFLSGLLTSFILVNLLSFLRRITFRPLYLFLNLVLFAAGTLGIKILIGRAIDIKDDAHIFEILASKFSNFRNFHTSLYTCAVEFDFLEYSTYWKLTKTLILPACILALFFLTAQVLKIELPLILWRPRETSGPKPFGVEVYNLIQLCGFTVMAVLIMRLKLFWTPHVCIMSALLASKTVIPWFRDEDSGSNKRLEAVCILLIALMGVEGVGNITHQWNIMGEYSNIPQEELFEWITTKTDKDAVFGGPMPTMANVKLTTERPIVNHPHYEDEGLRERTMKVYSIFSRKPISEVYETLKSMGVNYVIFESGWCSRGPKEGCSMPEIWDLVDPENKDRPALCNTLKGGNIAPFKVAFQNNQYRVFLVQ